MVLGKGNKDYSVEEPPFSKKFSYFQLYNGHSFLQLFGLLNFKSNSKHNVLKRKKNLRIYTSCVPH